MRIYGFVRGMADALSAYVFIFLQYNLTLITERVFIDGVMMRRDIWSHKSVPAVALHAAL